MDINFINICIALATIFVGYIFGSFPSSIVLSKLLGKDDPRNYGSKNTGGTNASRLWGFKIGIFVFVLDFLKLLIPLYGTWALFTFVKFNGITICPTAEEFLTNAFTTHYCYWPIYYLIIISVIVGHCYPIFSHFVGGKGAACTFSTAFFSSWFVGISALLAFAATLKIKKYVSLSSIVGSIVAAISAWLTLIPGLSTIVMYGYTLAPHWLYGLVMTLASILLIYRHKSNIIRIKNHEERKVSWF